MKKLNLVIKSCSECPYFKSETVLYQNSYNVLFTCRKDYVAIGYGKNINSFNDPFNRVMCWCKLEDFSE